MDEQDENPAFSINPRRLTFELSLDGVTHVAYVSGEALDKLAGAEVGFEDGCKAAYAAHWQRIHQRAVEQLGAGIERPKVLAADI